MAVVGAKAKDAFAFGGGMGGLGNNYTKHQIKCHEVSPTYILPISRYNILWKIIKLQAYFFNDMLVTKKNHRVHTP